MSYAAEVREYILDCKDRLGMSTDKIVKELGISWDTVYNLYNYEKSLRDGTLKIIRAGNAREGDIEITLKELRGNKGKYNKKKSIVIQSEPRIEKAKGSAVTRETRKSSTQEYRLKEERDIEKIVDKQVDTPIAVDTSNKKQIDTAESKKKRRPNTRSKMARIIQMYSVEAASVNDIIKETKVAQITIKEILMENGIEIRYIKKKIPLNVKRQIIKRITNGEDRYSIAYEFGITAGMIDTLIPSAANISRELNYNTEAAENIAEKIYQKVQEKTSNESKNETTITYLGSWPEDIKQKIIEEYKNDINSTVIGVARNNNKPVNSVRRLLADTGVIRKRGPKSVEDKLGITSQHKIQMYDMREEGKSFEEIVARFPQHPVEKIRDFLNSGADKSWRERTGKLAAKRYGFTRLPDEDCDKILELRKLNKPVEEIALELGASTHIVHKVLSFTGNSYPQGLTNYAKATVFDKEKAEQMYKDGYSLRVIANEVKAPFGAVRTHLDSCGIIRTNKKPEEELQSIIRALKVEIKELNAKLAQTKKPDKELQDAIKATQMENRELRAKLAQKDKLIENMRKAASKILTDTESL